MKSYILVFTLAVFALLSESCGSSKDLSKQLVNTEQSKVLQSDENISFLQETNVSEEIEIGMTENSNTEEVMTKKMTVYDTSKPLDPITGKHPILSETEEQITKTQNTDKKKETLKNKAETSKIELDYNISNHADETIKDNSILEIEKTKDETNLIKDIKVLVIWIIVLVFILLFGYVYFKKRD